MINVFKSRFLSMIALGLLAALSVRAAPTATVTTDADDPYKVAVLFPTEQPLMDIGTNHMKSIRAALPLAEGESEFRVAGQRFKVLFRGTGNPADTLKACRTEASEVIGEENVVAILGPVSSDCTEEILSDTLGVPVLSSLSTAPDLGSESEWFFRTISDDEDRIQTLLDTARAQGVPVDSSIAIYKPTRYGRGLLRQVQEEVRNLDSHHQFPWNEVIPPQGHGITISDSFQEFLAQHHDVKHVFMLGSSIRISSVLRSLRRTIVRHGSRPSFSLFGSREYALDVPPQTWIVGSARVRSSTNLITELSEADTGKNLFIPSMDAAVALRRALRKVFKESEDRPSPDELREGLTDKLENGSFHSVERRRLITFTDGEIDEPANTPIWKVSSDREIDNLNREKTESWVEIDVVKKPDGHLEGPIVVELIPRGDDLVNKTLTLYAGGMGGNGVPITDVTLDRSGTRVRFAPSFLSSTPFPESFYLDTDQTPLSEQTHISGLAWPRSYLIAGLLALFGALLYSRYKKRGSADQDEDTPAAWSISSYAQRCVAGILIAFLVIHVGPLLETGPLSTIPIPQFGASTWINAMVSGLLGGWLGLNPIVGLVASVISALTPVFQA